MIILYKGIVFSSKMSMLHNQILEPEIEVPFIQPNIYEYPIDCTGDD